MQVKPAKTYQEQVDLIKEKGFIVDDREACITFLKQANYYRLSAYFLPFRKTDGTFVHGVHFQRVQRIYEFDNCIRILLLQAIERIELYTRTQLAYYLGHRYGPLGYLNDAIFSDKHNVSAFRKRIDRHIDENRQTLIVKHHMEKYGGKFPIWVLIEFFSIGSLSYLYADLISTDQKAIAKTAFSQSATCLKSWLRCLAELRNRCAHYSRIYYSAFSSTPKMPPNTTYNNPNNHLLFPQILMLKYLYPDKDEWRDRMLPGIANLIISSLPDIDLNHIGFPYNWREILF